MASFTPLSNYLDSVVKISVFSNSTECSGFSKWICFCNLWGGRTGSPMLVKSWFQGFFHFTYVRRLTFFTLYFVYRSYHILFVWNAISPQTHLICSENPLIYVMTTGIFLALYLSSVTFTSSDPWVVYSFIYFSLFSPFICQSFLHNLCKCKSHWYVEEERLSLFCLKKITIHIYIYVILVIIRNV